MKKSILFLILLSAFAIKSKAQVAMVNSKKVVESMAEFAKIDTLIAKEKATYAIEYNRKQLVVNGLVSKADSLFKIDAKATTTTKAISDAQTADKDLKAYTLIANKKMAEYSTLLTKPYTDKIYAAIKIVATRAKFMQVFDSQSINTLYVNPLTDITDQVIKELKLK